MAAWKQPGIVGTGAATGDKESWALEEKIAIKSVKEILLLTTAELCNPSAMLSVLP